MRTIESWIFAYLLNSLWQLPLIALGAGLATRLMRRAGPLSQHRVCVGALLLQIVVPACHLGLVQIWRRMWEQEIAENTGRVRVVVGRASPSGAGLFNFSPTLLTVLLVMYAAVLLFFSCRLVRGIWTTRKMYRNAAACPLSDEVQRKLTAAADEAGFNIESVKMVVSPMAAGPVTAGIFSPVLLFPPGLLESIREEDLAAVLAHEKAHVQRSDFAKNLFYECLCLPATYHPLLWLTRARVAETREMVCDAMAASTVDGRENYARSLLRLASALSGRTNITTIHAIGILDAHSFERRIMSLTRKSIETRRLQRIVMAAASLLIAVVACGSALALRVDVEAPAPAPATAPKSIPVKPGDGTIIHRVPPVYPREAKANKDTVDGSVILSLKIGKDGTPFDVQVKKSLRADYDQSALDAVRQWRWQPFLLNGNPAEIDSDVTVTFSLEK